MCHFGLKKIIKASKEAFVPKIFIIKTSNIVCFPLKLIIFELIVSDLLI